MHALTQKCVHYCEYSPHRSQTAKLPPTFPDSHLIFFQFLVNLPFLFSLFIFPIFFPSWTTLWNKALPFSCFLESKTPNWIFHNNFMILPPTHFSKVTILFKDLIFISLDWVSTLFSFTFSIGICRSTQLHKKQNAQHFMLTFCGLNRKVLIFFSIYLFSLCFILCLCFLRLWLSFFIDSWRV